MARKSHIEGIITAGTSLLMRGTLECEFPPYWLSKRHMSCSAFQWYKNPTWKVSTPLEHPCWREELLNVNSLQINSAKDTCLVPLPNGTKIPHRRYHHRWNILVDERNSWMWISSILTQQKTHVLFRFPMVQKSHMEGINTAGTSLLKRGTLECKFPLKV